MLMSGYSQDVCVLLLPVDGRRHDQRIGIVVWKKHFFGSTREDFMPTMFNVDFQLCVFSSLVGVREGLVWLPTVPSTLLDEHITWKWKGP